MAVIKPTYEATDGTKFSDAESAERHNVFLEARNAFDDSWRNLKRAAIKEYKTADGFDFDESAGYWWNERCYLITGEYSIYPSIIEISLYPREIRSISVDKEGGVIITTNFYIGGNSKENTFKLSDLYKKKENAQKRLAEILRERISDFEKQITELNLNL